MHNLLCLQLEHSVRALACRGDVTFAAVKNDIAVCQRVRRYLPSGSRSLCPCICKVLAEQKLIGCPLLHRITTYSGHSGPIIQLLNLGNVLLSLGSDRRLIVWEDGVHDVPKVTDISWCSSHIRTMACELCMSGRSALQLLLQLLLLLALDRCNKHLHGRMLKLACTSPALVLFPDLTEQDQTVGYRSASTYGPMPSRVPCLLSHFFVTSLCCHACNDLPHAERLALYLQVSTPL